MDVQPDLHMGNEQAFYRIKAAYIPQSIVNHPIQGLSAGVGPVQFRVDVNYSDSYESIGGTGSSVSEQLLSTEGDWFDVRFSAT